MKPRKKDPPPCKICGKPSVGAHTFGQTTWMVCAACHEQKQVQEALDSRIIDILKLSSAGQTDEALACLDEIWQANRDHDHDRSLARSVAIQRSGILFEAGRYAENEQALNDWAQAGFADPAYAMFHADSVALNLQAQGRTQEAIHRLEESLAQAAPPHLWTAFGLLRHLVVLLEGLGRSIDPKWQSLAEAAAKARGFDLPDWRAKSSSLGEAIREVDAACRARQDEEVAALRAKRAKKEMAIPRAKRAKKSVTKQAKRVKNATSER